MQCKPAFLGILIALVFPWTARAQTSTAAPLTAPPASLCASGAENYGAIVSFLNNGNIYKSTVLAPAISSSKTYSEFETYLGQALAVDEQQLAFLKTCKLSTAPFCQPGSEAAANTTPAEVASMLEAFDADEGLTAIQGFFSIPAAPANFQPHQALLNFSTVTQGSYCLFATYLVHPSVVKGLKPSSL